MSEPPNKERLEALQTRINKAREALEPRPSKAQLSQKWQGLSIVWRMTLEMALGVLFGLGIGLGLDRLLGTKPWLLIVFAILGVAAGIKTVLRTAKDLEIKGDSK